MTPRRFGRPKETTRPLERESEAFANRKRRRKIEGRAPRFFGKAAPFLLDKRDSNVVPKVSAAVLTDWMSRLFQAAGVDRAESDLVAESLVGSNLRGHDSHGVMRVPQYIERLQAGDYRAGVDLKVERETKATLATDGLWGFGQVQARRLLDLTMTKARAVGLAAGTGRRFGHVGRLGEYAELAAEQGLALIATVNNDGAGRRVAPPGGLEARLGTNPLCIGAPTLDGPIILDFGTSAAAEGKVRVHYIDGKRPVPDGWLIDHQGKPTNDPAVLYEPPLGTILPVGGPQAYKGFGLGFALDALVAGLSGGRTCHDDAPVAKGNNVLLIVFEPDAFVGRDHLIAQATALARHTRDCRKAVGVDAIRLPGDPERECLAERSAEGIPIAEPHWRKLAEVSERLQVAEPVLEP